LGSKSNFDSEAGVFFLTMHLRKLSYKRLLFSLSFVILLMCGKLAYAQQRPLLTEDPRLIPAGSLDFEAGFGFEKNAVYTVSNLEGNHVALFPLGLNFGLGDNAEFQMNWTVHDYLHTADDVWHSDFGDVSLSTKMKVAGESGKVPSISFRPTVILPNANQHSGLGLNTTRFFANVLLGKTIGRLYVYGNIGFGIVDDPTVADAQNDPVTYGLAAIIPVASKVNWVSEINGVNNPRESPALGSESRSQARSGFQIEASGIRWDVGLLAGLTKFDPDYGIVFGMTKRFKK
jgi:hypothetical protein